MKKVIIQMIKNGPLGAARDNLNRAKAAFNGLSEEQMKSQYGQSGSTRQEIINTYQSSVDEAQECIDWLNRQA